MAQTSKKLYKAVAEEINAEWRIANKDNGGFYRQVVLSNTSERLAHIFSADNPNFDRGKFYAACHKEDK